MQFPLFSNWCVGFNFLIKQFLLWKGGWFPKEVWSMAVCFVIRPQQLVNTKTGFCHSGWIYANFSVIIWNHHTSKFVFWRLFGLGVVNQTLQTLKGSRALVFMYNVQPRTCDLNRVPVLAQCIVWSLPPGRIKSTEIYNYNYFGDTSTNCERWLVIFIHILISWKDGLTLQGVENTVVRICTIWFSMQIDQTRQFTVVKRVRTVAVGCWCDNRLGCGSLSMKARGCWNPCRQIQFSWMIVIAKGIGVCLGGLLNKYFPFGPYNAWVQKKYFQDLCHGHIRNVAGRSSSTNVRVRRAWGKSVGNIWRQNWLLTWWI